ncbi:THO complex subunit 6 [Pelomyxa schiedti]|nr:THO complex subunit 6 [Pelomyxa schiedti]
MSFQQFYLLSHVNILLWDWSKFLGSIEDDCGTSTISPPPCLATLIGSSGITSSPRNLHPEVNALAVDINRRRLFAGCGDGRVCVFDTDTLELINTMNQFPLPSLDSSSPLASTSTTSPNPVYCICLCNSTGQILTGSEDGLLRIYDPDSCKPIRYLSISSSALSPTQCWIGCIAVDPSETWMACGSDKTIQLWHLPSLTQVTTIRISATPQTFCWLKDPLLLLCGCNQSQIIHIKMNGTISHTVVTSSPSIWSITKHPNEGFVVTGSSSSIDIFQERAYKLYSLNF